MASAATSNTSLIHPWAPADYPCQEALSAGDSGVDRVSHVIWGDATVDADTGKVCNVTGTIVLADGVAALAIFVAGSIRFSADGTTDCGTTWRFSYGGARTLETLKAGLKDGVIIAYAG